MKHENIQLFYDHESDHVMRKKILWLWIIYEFNVKGFNKCKHPMMFFIINNTEYYIIIILWNLPLGWSENLLSTSVGLVFGLIRLSYR